MQQQYESEVNNEYVIRGNSAILKCSIPSFVADFVNVVSWHDDEENVYTADGPKEGDETTTATSPKLSYLNLPFKIENPSRNHIKASGQHTREHSRPQI